MSLQLEAAVGVALRSCCDVENGRAECAQDRWVIDQKDVCVELCGGIKEGIEPVLQHFRLDS